MTPDERELWEERAAILEFDAGFSRDEAERLAREQLERHDGTQTELEVRR